jgi:hypothetical protein
MFSPYWEQVYREMKEQRARRRRRARATLVRYRQHPCPLCGRVISESAFSGKTGNLTRHYQACQRKRKEESPP